MRSWILDACLAVAHSQQVGYGGPNPFHVARMLLTPMRAHPGFDASGEP